MEDRRGVLEELENLKVSYLMRYVQWNTLITSYYYCIFIIFVIVSRGVGSPLPAVENFDSPPLNFLLPGSSKTEFPPSGGFRHFDSN